MAVYIEPQFKPTRSARRALELLDTFYALWMSPIASELLQERRISKSKAQGNVCGLSALRGEAVEGSLGLLRSLSPRREGYGPTWNQRNDIADGGGEVGRSASPTSASPW